jgi:hypothetical protein
MGLQAVAGGDAANTIDTTTQAMATAIDSQTAIFSQGVFASRPVSTPGTPGKTGRFYYATDTLELYYDFGTGWKRVWPPDSESVTADMLADSLVAALGVNDSEGVRRGKSIIAAEESRTNVAYGKLTTPDEVQNVVLPADGLIVVGYHALWKESVADASRAAIFIGANQLTIASSVQGGAARATAAVQGGTADKYRTLTSFSGGLLSTSSDTSPAHTNIATGQVLGAYAGSTSGIATWEVGTQAPLLQADENALGGLVCVFAAAGTYTVSVQFKASSGSVTAKERKLWVWTLGF